MERACGSNSSSGIGGDETLLLDADALDWMRAGSARAMSW
jgi:hypothetical protein